VLLALVRQSDVPDAQHAARRRWRGLGFGWERLRRVQFAARLLLGPRLRGRTGRSPIAPPSTTSSRVPPVSSRSRRRRAGRRALSRTLIGDKTVGLTRVYAVMAALLQRARTGEGQAIEVPMLETMTAFVMAEHMGG